MRLQFGELNITPIVEERLQELDYTVQELQEAIANHKSECDGEPSVYVGTYAKYNEGSLRGLWIDLSSFNDYDEFINFCKAIHADEEDPELMAQDYECFPRQWYTEGFMSEDDFDHILEYSDMCDKHGNDAVDDYLEFHDSLDNFEEAYCGEWDSEEDFARHIVEECYNLEKMMGSLANYFDYEAFARELFDWDYTMGANGNVFRRV
ncbi:MAG: antirestriction protein ArdA [Lachnospiraceae bacterium]|nr:antirestriction protein ArdA [Lachnospiraceae bacterium]